MELITTRLVGTYVPLTPGHVYQTSAGSGYPELLHIKESFSILTTALGEPERYISLSMKHDEEEEKEKSMNKKMKRKRR